LDLCEGVETMSGSTDSPEQSASGSAPSQETFRSSVLDDVHIGTAESLVTWCARILTIPGEDSTLQAILIAVSDFGCCSVEGCGDECNVCEVRALENVQEVQERTYPLMSKPPLEAEAEAEADEELAGS
jgi:hypothetical protein